MTMNEESLPRAAKASSMLGTAVCDKQETQSVDAPEQLLIGVHHHHGATEIDGFHHFATDNSSTVDLFENGGGAQLAGQVTPSYMSQIASDLVSNGLELAFNDPRLVSLLQEALRNPSSEEKGEAGRKTTHIENTGAAFTEEQKVLTEEPGRTYRSTLELTLSYCNINDDDVQNKASPCYKAKLPGDDNKASTTTRVPEALIHASPPLYERCSHHSLAECSYSHSMQAGNNDDDAALSNSCYSVINTSADESQKEQAYGYAFNSVSFHIESESYSNNTSDQTGYDLMYNSKDNESEDTIIMDASNTTSGYSRSNPFVNGQEMNSPDDEVAGIFSHNPQSHTSGGGINARPRVDITIDECSSGDSDNEGGGGMNRQRRLRGSGAAPRIIVDECSSYASSSDDEGERHVVAFPRVDIQIDECSSNCYSSEENIYRLQKINQDLEAANQLPARNRDLSNSELSSSSEEEGEYIIEPRFREFADRRFREIESFRQISLDHDETQPTPQSCGPLYSIGEDEGDKVSAENLKNTAVHGFVDIVIDECASNPVSPDFDPSQPQSGATQPKPDLVIHECSSNADSDEDEDIKQVTIGPTNVAITIDECSSNANSSSDDEEICGYFSETQVAADSGSAERPSANDLGDDRSDLEGSNDRDLSQEVLEEVNAFVSDVIRSAVIQCQKETADMTHVEETPESRRKVLIRPELTDPSRGRRETDDFYTEEIKQMRDQIPEELSAHAPMDNRCLESAHFSSGSRNDNLHYDLDASDIHLHNQTASSDLDFTLSDLSISDVNSNSDWNSSRDASGNHGVAQSGAYESFQTALGASKNVFDTSDSQSRTLLESTRRDNGPQSPVRPTTLTTGTKRTIQPDMDAIDDDGFDLELTETRSRSSSTSTEGCDSSTMDLSAKTPDSLTTMEAMEGAGVSWVPEKPPPEKIPEYTAEEELEDRRHWRTVTVAGAQYKVDIKVIEPYKQVLSHGGYYGDGFNAIIVFSACHLPDRRRRDYQYVMDNLFLYLLSTLELLVVEDYMLIYFHGATPTHKVPPLSWLRKCQQAIDRRLKKNLKQLLVVHPTLWLKTVILMTKPFVSSKFYDKMIYVRSLRQLADLVPTEYIFVPKPVQQYDDDRFKNGSNPTTPS